MNVISYEYIIMWYVWACRETAVPVLVFSLPFCLSPFVALWRPLFLWHVFFNLFLFLFFINLSGRHTSPRVLQLPDNTKED